MDFALSNNVSEPDPLMSQGVRRRWPGTVTATGPEADNYAAMIDSLRLFLDRVSGSRPSPEASSELARKLDELSSDLEKCQVVERDQLFGHLPIQGRAQSMSPQFFTDESDDQSVAGRVTFRCFFLGGNGAAHGGSIPLLFDEVLGRLANTGGRAGSRTAYLNVNFRSIARVGNELALTARFVREEGRKRFIASEIFDGDILVADAEGLFVALRPGQP